MTWDFSKQLASARQVARVFEVELGGGAVTLEVRGGERLRLTVVRSRAEGVESGDDLAVVDLPIDEERHGPIGIAVTFNGGLALRTHYARCRGEPSPGSLAAARAFVTALARAAGAPDERELLAALGMVDDPGHIGPRLNALYLHESLFPKDP